MSLFSLFLTLMGLIESFQLEHLCPSIFRNSLIKKFPPVIIFHYFFCSNILECLCIGCRTTQIDCLIIQFPLLLIFLSLQSIFQALCSASSHSIELSCLLLLFFKKLRGCCVLCLFHATFSCFMTILCSLTSRRVLPMGFEGLEWAVVFLWIICFSEFLLFWSL